MSTRIHLPKLFPEQQRALFGQERFVAIEGSTKSGKSVAAALWLFVQCLLRGGDVLWTSPRYQSSKEIGFKNALALVPDELLDGKPVVSPVPVIRIAGKRSMVFGSADNPYAPMGLEYSAAVVDEANLISEDAWPSVLSTLTATMGPARLLGNTTVGSWFDLLLAQIRNGDKGPEWAAHQLSWEDSVSAGVITVDAVRAAYDSLPLPEFKRLYLCVGTEGGYNPFGLQHIKNALSGETTPGRKEADISWTSELHAHNEVVAWGWDFAFTSNSTSDWNFGVGLDESGNVCRIERFHADLPEAERRVVACTGDAYAELDNTGIGIGIVQSLEGTGNPDQWEGVNFTASSKPKLVQVLAKELQHSNLSIPEGVLAGEMRDFQAVPKGETVKYAAKHGRHDDGVCALALANKCLLAINYGTGYYEGFTAHS